MSVRSEVTASENCSLALRCPKHKKALLELRY